MCQDDVAQLCSQAKVAQQLAGRLQEAASGRGCTDTQVCPLATGPALQAKEKTGVGYWGWGWGAWDGNRCMCPGTRPRGAHLLQENPDALPGWLSFVPMYCDIYLEVSYPKGKL